MAEEIIITASRADIDDVVFSAAQEYAETTPLSLRERMKLTLELSDRIMLGIDELGGAAKRSDNAKKAAMARHAKPKPTPGPAIPTPDPLGRPAPTVDPSQGIAPPPLLVKPPANEQATTAPLPPPPHPALMPQGAPAAPQPFGAPPA
jgi:hypothetical protein